MVEICKNEGVDNLFRVLFSVWSVLVQEAWWLHRSQHDQSVSKQQREGQLKQTHCSGYVKSLSSINV